MLDVFLLCLAAFSSYEPSAQSACMVGDFDSHERQWRGTRHAQLIVPKEVPSSVISEPAVEAEAPGGVRGERGANISNEPPKKGIPKSVHPSPQWIDRSQAETADAPAKNVFESPLQEGINLPEDMLAFLAGWARLVQRKIENAWEPPDTHTPSGSNDKVVVSFWLDCQGTLLGKPEIIDNTSDQSLAESGIQAVLHAFPFPSLPDAFPHKELQIMYKFSVSASNEDASPIKTIHDAPGNIQGSTTTDTSIQDDSGEGVDRDNDRNDHTQPLVPDVASNKVPVTIQVPNAESVTTVRFNKSSSGVITDSRTGLEWFVGKPKNVSPVAAAKWAASLDIEGVEWRLPTVNELRSLHEQDSVQKVKIDPVFEPCGTEIVACDLTDETDDYGQPLWPVFNFRRGSAGMQIANGMSVLTKQGAMAVRGGNGDGMPMFQTRLSAIRRR